MRNYNICGHNISITNGQENYRLFNIKMKDVMENIIVDFDSWYDKKFNCEAVCNSSEDFIMTIFNPMIDKVLEIMNKYNVFTIDHQIIYEKYLYDCYDEWFRNIDIMMNEIYYIEEEKQAQYDYRRERKACRRKVVGGGFGIGGAIKGMAEAGAINTVSGTAHTLFNMVGNAGTAIASSGKKSEVYSKYKTILRNTLIDISYRVKESLMFALTNEVNIKFEVVSQEDANKSKAIMNNIDIGRVPADKKLDFLIEALRLNIYDVNIYSKIWLLYGDSNNELIKLSRYFGVDLDAYINSIASDYCDKTIASHCSNYINSKNKIMDSIKYEKDILDAYNDIINFCNERNIDSSSIKQKLDLENLLKEIDLRCRTYLGHVWENRQKVKDIKEDFGLFYKYLSDKDINEEGMLNKLSILNYKTNEFRNMLNDIFLNEIKLRNPREFFENINEILYKNLGDESKIYNMINIDRIDERLDKKLELINNIIEMQQNEIPVLLIDRSLMQKGKTGVMITNFNLRVYSKTLLDKENSVYKLEDIKKIDYIGDGEFLITINNEVSRFKINLEEYSIEIQNTLCEAIWQIINMIRNISFSVRKQLSHIYRESVLCECGTYISPNKKFCPNCRKIVVNGKTVESIVCSKCGKIIEKGKKFCPSCGNSLLFERVDESKDKEDNIICPKCGNKIDINKKFCSKCGTKVKE